MPSVSQVVQWHLKTNYTYAVDLLRRKEYGNKLYKILQNLIEVIKTKYQSMRLNHLNDFL